MNLNVSQYWTTLSFVNAITKKYCRLVDFFGFEQDFEWAFSFKSARNLYILIIIII